MANPFDSYATGYDSGPNPQPAMGFDGGPQYGSAPPPDMAARVSGWNAFLEALKQPGVAQALIQGGATMMQPIPQGGSSAGQIGKGLAVGAQVLSQQQQQNTENQQRDATIREGQQRTSIYRQQVQGENDRYAAGAPARQAELDLALEQLRQARDPETRKLALDKAKAEIDKLHAEADYARAGKSRDTQQPPSEVQMSNQEIAAIMAENPGMTRSQAVLRQRELSRSSKSENPINIWTQAYKMAQSNSIFDKSTPQDWTETANAATAEMFGPDWKNKYKRTGTTQPTPDVTKPASTDFSSYSSPIARVNGSTPAQSNLPKSTPADQSEFTRMLPGLTPAQADQMRAKWRSMFSDQPPG